MAWTDKQVEATIYRILDSAQGNDWQIEQMSPNHSFHNGSIQIRGESPLKIQTHEELNLVMEAYIRMKSELGFVSYHNGVVHRVTPRGRDALKLHKQRLHNASKTLNVIGLSFGPEDYTAITDWAEKCNASAAIAGAKPAFRDNAYQKVGENRDQEIDGFVIANCAAFKPSALSGLYTQAKHFSFHLYAVERGTEPFGDCDVEEEKPEAIEIPANVNITINGNQNTVAANGSIIRDVQNHLQTVQQTNPDIADILKEFFEAVQNSSLQTVEIEKVLFRIDDIAEQIGKKPAEAKYPLIVERTRNLVEYVVALVSINHGVQYLAEHSDKLLNAVTTIFGAH